MGVILQTMVHASAAGIALGCHPTNPTRHEIVIEAVAGLADAAVSGQASPYRATISNGGILKVEYPHGHGAGHVGRSKNPLRDDQWHAVARLIRSL